LSATVKSEEAAEIKRYAERLFYRYGGDLDPIIAGLFMRRIISSGEETLGKVISQYCSDPCHDNEELRQIFYQELMSLVSSAVMPTINRFIDDCDFNFFDAVSDSGSISVEFIRERIYFIFKETLDSGAGEIILNSSFNILRYRIIDKYLDEIFAMESELYREIIKEVPKSFSLKDCKNFIKTIFVVRPSLYPEINWKSTKHISDEERRVIAKRYESRFRPIPCRIIDEAVKSFNPMNVTSGSNAVAGLVYIFDLFCRVSPWQGVPEPGAEPPHKSWFSLALINSEYFGFNTGILEELYCIAGERNW